MFHKVADTPLFCHLKKFPKMHPELSISNMFLLYTRGGNRTRVDGMENTIENKLTNYKEAKDTKLKGEKM